jgi:hypothetical protein
MTVAAYTKARLEEELSGNGLSPLQNRALALLIESHLTLPQIAQELGINRQRLWEIRKDPEFQAAYREQMAILESSALQYAIASRVERIAALNTAWLQVRDELAKRKTPRVDLTYAMVNLQQAAAKELGQDVQRVEFGGRLKIEQAVRVIRFEAQEPQREVQEPDASESGVIDADYHEMTSVPDSDAEFTRALQAAGMRIDRATAQPKELTAIRCVIEARGLDPREVLSDDQYRAVYGREKGGDPWTI